MSTTFNASLISKIGASNHEFDARLNSLESSIDSKIDINSLDLEARLTLLETKHTEDGAHYKNQFHSISQAFTNQEIFSRKNSRILYRAFRIMRAKHCKPIPPLPYLELPLVVVAPLLQHNMVSTRRIDSLIPGRNGLTRMAWSNRVLLLLLAAAATGLMTQNQSPLMPSTTLAFHSTSNSGIWGQNHPTR